MKYYILLADDEPNVLTGMRIFLKENCRFSVEVDVAANGEDALALLEKNLYHLLVSDVKMPGMGGIELMKKASALQPALPIIMLTGHEDFQDIYATTAYPNVRYILKVEDGDKIIALVDKTLADVSIPPEQERVDMKTMIANIETYINENILEGISVSTVAGKFHFNPSYFSRMYKNYTGAHLSNYIKAVQIQKAKELLSRPGNRINDISVKLGFSSTSYFIADFKKKVGMTPKQYKQTFLR
jgi:YesN/AraC family two-component response regulator